MFVLSLCSVLISHPPVGEVSETLFHQDGLQQVRVHHSQHGLPQLIGAARRREITLTHFIKYGGLGFSPVYSPPYFSIFLSTLLVIQVVNLINGNTRLTNCVEHQSAFTPPALALEHN